MCSELTCSMATGYLGWEQPHDHRRVNIGRQRLDGCLRNRRNIGFTATQVDAVLKINIDDGVCRITNYSYIFDALDRLSQIPFKHIGNTPFDIRRHQVVIDPDDGTDGNLDHRKHVGRGFRHRKRAEQHDEDGRTTKVYGLLRATWTSLFMRQDPLLLGREILHHGFWETRSKVFAWKYFLERNRHACIEHS